MLRRAGLQGDLAAHGGGAGGRGRPLERRAEREETAGGRRRLRFAETPPLPTYLVALVVGRIEAPSARRRCGGRGPHLGPAREARALTGFGQDVAVEVLPRLEDYFGVPYAFGKLDQVGLPEFEAGAMENAGLVTYREVALLLDPATASLAQKKRVAEVVTHELAHQWFGNWVTMTWWDDLWLNEAFATWMAYKIVDEWLPAWRVWLDFDQGKAAALQLDALRSTHPIRAEVRNVAEAGEAFDLITYEKGGAVLRMIEGYLGAERFRDGIRLYMRRHAKRNAVADDLWGALAEASARAGGGARERLDRAARVPARRASPASAARSASSSAASCRIPPRRRRTTGSRWPVPLVLRYGDGERMHGAARAPARRRARGAARGRGRSRLRLRQRRRDRLLPRGVRRDRARRARRATSPRLAPAERIALLSDEWALVRAGAREIGPFLDLVASFGTERGPRRARRAGRAARRPSSTGSWRTPTGRRSRRWSRRSSARSLAATGWDAAPGEPDAAPAAPGGGGARARAGRAATEGVVARGDRAPRPLARRRPERARAEPARRRRGDGGARRRRGALRAAPRAVHGRRPIPRSAAAGCSRSPRSRSPALAARAIELAFGGRGPAAGRRRRSSAALLANRAAREPFWDRLRADWERLHERVKGAPMLLRRVVEAMGELVERRHLEEAEAFLAAHPLEEARQAIAQTLERLRQDVALRERRREASGAGSRRGSRR